MKDELEEDASGALAVGQGTSTTSAMGPADFSVNDARMPTIMGATIKRKPFKNQLESGLFDKKTGKAKKIKHKVKWV